MNNEEEGVQNGTALLVANEIGLGEEFELLPSPDPLAITVLARFN
jgi:hypothetical protein